ncbi:MAG: acetyl-CoA carboxylase biotin carboxyl carrier protein [Oscillospiraceae bacterium]|nr:acetyl-CoA carboxylase biotin carboxyl carrier protein [Oscillospiraceae bacterium]
MNETDIRKYAELMRELGLTGLEITEDNSKVRLERNTAPVPETVYAVPETVQAAPAAVSDGCISVRSPIVGVFYAAPAENADPYVAVGETVKKGQILCIIEAMKLMNEITAEEDGIISEVCVTNGQVVEYGTELFRIKR